MSRPVVTASQPCPDPPAWAVLQRELIAALEAAADIYLAKYARPNGTLIYADTWPNGRDGLDDLYEAFYNLPMLYMLGGDARFLALAHHHWEAVNRQAAGYGLVQDEYELGYDQFHQSEGNQFFYLLCAADPENPTLIERARRFANLYLGQPNYDPGKNIIRAFHTGAGGPRWGYFDDDRNIWNRFMEPFGLPFDDVPGVQSFEDLGDWHEGDVHADNRHRMNETMNVRMGEGDSVANLLVTSLATNAYLMTGDETYRNWVETYVSGWWKRAETNGGLIPDNVGLDGRVGSQFEGRWYGAAYGWTWPLGYDVVNDAVTVAAMNATLVSGSIQWMDLPGKLFDFIFDKGELTADFTEGNPPRPDPWVCEAAKTDGSKVAFVAPKKHKDAGWFAKYPFYVGPLASWWCTTFATKDAARLSALQKAEPQDWAISYSFRAKGDDGHERPWLEYQAGRNAGYPEVILKQSLDLINARLAMIADDRADLTKVNIHHWQNRNPVTTEALIQLTLGAPQQRYNGGFLRACFRYFDAQEGRPGLPQDVSALVSDIDAGGARLTLVNLSKVERRHIQVQGGFYGENRIRIVTEAGSNESLAIDVNTFLVELPPATSVKLIVAMERFSETPQLATKNPLVLEPSM